MVFVIYTYIYILYDLFDNHDNMFETYDAHMMSVVHMIKNDLYVISHIYVICEMDVIYLIYFMSRIYMVYVIHVYIYIHM